MAAPDASSTPLSSAKSLRGLNKPKCIKCGNVARSRCPFQSCKNCCAKAQNPCHIHVLKGTSSLPEKPPSSSSPQVEQQPTEVSYSVNINRLRQLSNNFTQFNNLQTPLRSRKPLTKKDAQVINEWRFIKLKEFKERKVEVESDAFDRYMQNVDLLEEIFLFNSTHKDQVQVETSSEVDSSASGDNTHGLVHGLKLKLRSNSVRSDNFRKRIQYIVDQGLKKLGKVELTDGDADLSDAEALGQPAKKIKFSQGEKGMGLCDLSDKLNRARNEEDVKACQEMASQIFQWNTRKKKVETDEIQSSKEHNATDESCTKQPSSFFPPKWVNPATIDQEALCRLDAQFSSLEEIEDL